MIKNMKTIKENISEAKHVFLNCAYVYLNSSRIGVPPQLPIFFFTEVAVFFSV